MSVERPLIRDMLNGTLNSRIETTQFFAGFNNFGLTPAEKSTGNTPTDYSFTPGDVRRFDGDSSNTFDSSSAVSKANTVALSADKSIQVAGGTYKISVDTTISPSISVNMENGGSFYVDSGKTLTMPVPIADRRQLFFGPGTVLFSNDILQIHPSYPEWFGAVKDGTTTDYAAFTKCIAATPDSGEIELAPGAYATDNGIHITKSLKMTGCSMRGTLIIGVATMSTVLTVDNTCDSVTLEDFSLDCRTVSNDLIDYLLMIKGVRTFLNRVGAVPRKRLTTAVFSTDPDATVYQCVVRDAYIEAYDNNSSTPIGLRFCRGHTMVADGCMVGGWATSQIRAGGFTGGATGTNVQGLSLVSCRIEAFSGDSSPYPGSHTAVGVDAREVNGLSIVGCNFEMDADGSASNAAHRAVKLTTVLGGAIAGNEFKAGGQATAAIDVADSTCKGVVIQGNNFNDWNGYGVVASGTGSLTNVEIGINRALAPTTGVWNNSFTPLIAFGGAAVGITYGSQFGRWQRSGDYIEWTLRVVLTSKGSSTGTLRITGLPVASSSVSNNDISFAVFASGLTGVTGGIAGYHASNQSSLRLWYTGTGTATELTDATFTNSTEIYASGKYFAPVN